jgi:hypothetical protein
MPSPAKCASWTGGFCRQDPFGPWALLREVVLVQFPSLARLPRCANFLSVLTYLPPPDLMDARALSAHGAVRNDVFYLTALTYGHYLWLRGLASRGILKLDRALCADLHGDKPALRRWPSLCRHGVVFHKHSGRGFAGNPRVYQQLADRMKEPRREQRRWRMWACWSSGRVVWPDLPGDPKHPVEEPAIDHIVTELQIHGVPGELETRRAAMKAASRDFGALTSGRFRRRADAGYLTTPMTRAAGGRRWIARRLRP